MDELISVIITTHCRDFETLQMAIESAINQTYKNIEIIVVNDTPKEDDLFDTVSERIKIYDGKLVYVADGICRGACAARNRGVRLSNGNYIALLDDDDVWHNNKLEVQYRYMKSGDCCAVTCRYNTVVNGRVKSPNRLRELVIRGRYKKTLNRDKVISNNIVGGCSMPLIRKVAFYKAGEFDENLPRSQDADLWIRLSRIGDIFLTKEVLVDYYIHSGQRISDSRQKRIDATKILLDKYPEMGDIQKKAMYLQLAEAYWGMNDREKGKKYLRKANEFAGIDPKIILYQFRIIKHRIK